MFTTGQLVNKWNGRRSTGTVVTRPLGAVQTVPSGSRENAGELSKTFSWVSIVTPVPTERWSFKMTEVRDPDATGRFVPRTDLGRKLLTLRRQAIARGMTLLDADAILVAVRRGRGERSHDDEGVH